MTEGGALRPCSADVIRPPPPTPQSITHQGSAGTEDGRQASALAAHRAATWCGPAVDSWPAHARLAAVAPAGHLPTAPTPPPGTQLRDLPVLIRQRLTDGWRSWSTDAISAPPPRTRRRLNWLESFFANEGGLLPEANRAARLRVAYTGGPCGALCGVTRAGASTFGRLHLCSSARELLIPKARQFQRITAVASEVVRWPRAPARSAPEWCARLCKEWADALARPFPRFHSRCPGAFQCALTRRSCATHGCAWRAMGGGSEGDIQRSWRSLLNPGRRLKVTQI
jgi:hypothetical protein